MQNLMVPYIIVARGDFGKSTAGMSATPIRVSRDPESRPLYLSEDIKVKLCPDFALAIKVSNQKESSSLEWEIESLRNH